MLACTSEVHWAMTRQTILPGQGHTFYTTIKLFRDCHVAVYPINPGPCSCHLACPFRLNPIVKI
eukprot:2316698-Karenia_brevis.AAC.1